MWEYKVGNNANIASFKCLRKTRITKRGYIMVIVNLTNDITIPIRMVRLPLFPTDQSRCEAAGQKLQSRSFDIYVGSLASFIYKSFAMAKRCLHKGGQGRIQDSP